MGYHGSGYFEKRLTGMSWIPNAIITLIYGREVLHKHHLGARSMHMVNGYGVVMLTLCCWCYSLRLFLTVVVLYMLLSVWKENVVPMHVLVCMLSYRHSHYVIQFCTLYHIL